VKIVVDSEFIFFDNSDFQSKLVKYLFLRILSKCTNIFQNFLIFAPQIQNQVSGV